MTVTQRILAQVALATGLVIAVGTAVTYRLVLRATEQQGVTHLSDYVKERALAEQRNLDLVGQNLELTRALFLQRGGLPAPADLDQRWLARNELWADGAWRTRRAVSDGTNSATMWIRTNAPVTSELKTRVLRAEEVLNDLLLGWRDTFVSLYFIFPEQVNIGFDQRISQWIWDAKAEYDTCAPYFFQQATPQKNPSRRIVWSQSAREPVSQKPYVSVTAPIYHGDRFLGIVGHDIALGELMANTARSGIPDATHYLFRRDGRLIANPALEQRILNSEGNFSLPDSGDPGLQALFAAVSPRNEVHFTGYLPENNSYFAASVLHGPEWFFVTLMPGASLRAQALRSAQAVLWSGLSMLALVLVGFAVILRRQIAHPLAELARATSQMSAGDITARAAVSGEDELGRLAAAFNDMVAKVAARGAELHTLNQTLEERVAERTKKLRESEERFSKAFQASPALIALTRLDDGTFVAANEAFCKISGYTEAEVIGRRASDLNIYAQPRQREEYVRLIREYGSVRDREHVLRTKSGTLRTVLSSGESFDLDGQPHLLTVGLDITDRKQAEDEMTRALAREKELSELKSSFIAMVSHEFRTPLGVIVSSADILSRYLDRLAPAERASHLASIQSSVQRMAGMMEDVLLLGRFERGRLECQPDDLHLAAWCRRLADEMRSATGGRCPLELQIDLPDPMVRADEKLLRHILTNLISNAVKYSPADSPVQLRVRREQGDAVFEIIDHGRGIPTEDQPQIFEAFHRARNVGQIPGTGLGLVIVKRGVDLHGGKISVTSVEGQGATFVVRLPLFETSA